MLTRIIYSYLPIRFEPNLFILIKSLILMGCVGGEGLLCAVSAHPEPGPPPHQLHHRDLPGGQQELPEHQEAVQGMAFPGLGTRVIVNTGIYKIIW